MLPVFDLCLYDSYQVDSAGVGWMTSQYPLYDLDLLLFTVYR